MRGQPSPVASFSTRWRFRAAGKQLYIIGLFLTCASCFLLVVTDLLKSFRPVYPAVPILAVATLAHAGSGPAMHMAGHFQLDHYKLWQPFDGPTPFVVAQSFGWLIYGASLMMCLVATAATDKIAVDGLLLFIGLLSVGGQFLLKSSLELFTEEGEREIVVLPKQRTSGGVKAAVGLAIGGALLFVFADYLSPSSPNSPAFFAVSMMMFGWTAVLISCFITHYAGMLMHEGFKWWQPFEGGRRFVLMQVVGWGILGVTVLIVLVTALQIEKVPAHGLISLLGGLGLLAQLILAASLPRFELLSEPGRRPSLGKLAFVDRGWVPESLLSMILACSGSAFMLVIDLVSHLWFPKQQVVFLLMTGASFALYSSAPLVHWSGKTIFGKSFKLWQPFEGGFRFIILQAFGWSMYAISGTCVVVFVFNSRQWPFLAISAMAAFGWVSYFLIFLSVNHFAPAGRPSGPTLRLDLALSWSGEQVVGSLIALGCCLLFLLVEFMQGRIEGSARRIPNVSILAFATLGYCIAALVTQFAGKRLSPTFRMFQPFEGGATFVRLQAMGWTVFALSMLAQVVLLLNPLDLFVPGFVAVTGASGLIGNLILQFSLSHFEATYPENVPHPPVPTVGPLVGEMSVDDKSELQLLLEKATQPHVRVVLEQLIRAIPPPLSPPMLSPRVVSNENRGSVPLNEFLVVVVISVIPFCGLMGVDLLRKELSALSLDMFAVIGLVASGVSPLLTHCVLGPRAFPLAYRMWMPFSGGPRFALLQTIGWCMILFSSLVFGPSILMHGVHHLQSGGILAACALVMFVGQLLLLISLRYFMMNENKDGPFQGVRKQVTDDEWEKDYVPFQEQTSWVSALLVTISLLMFVGVDFLHSMSVAVPKLPVVFCCTIMVILSLPASYISRGSTPLVPSYVARGKGSSKYKFWSVWDSSSQAQGFLRLQTASWVIYSISVISGLCAIYNSLHALPVNLLASLTGVSGVTAYGLLIWSYQEYPEADESKKGIQLPVMAETEPRPASLLSPEGKVWLKNTLWVYASAYVIYTLHLLIYLVCSIVVVGLGTYGSFLWFAFILLRAFVPRKAAHFLIPMYICFAVYGMYHTESSLVNVLELTWMVLGLAYISTYYTNSHVSGNRRSQRARDSRWFWDGCEKFFGFKLIAEGELKPDAVYLYGFHPHGIYPFSLVWAPLASQWREKYKGIEMDSFCANTLMTVPFLRDVAMWLGSRDVSRAALSHCLSHKRSALLVPGGQAEMRESRSDVSELTLVYFHKGFVRLALQQQVPLVPVLSFGEQQIFDNVRLPSVQGWFVRNLGFGYPHFPYGKWGLPVPRRARITMVVGKPIPPPPLQAGQDPYSNDLQSVVDAFHCQYFDEIKRIFETYKAEAGYPDAILKLR